MSTLFDNYLTGSAGLMPILEAGLTEFEATEAKAMKIN
jgi:hypothetical protein